MRPLRRAVGLSLLLGAFSVVAVVLSYLALLDIWQGLEDLALEWSVVRAALLVIVLFQISALVTLGRVFQVLR
jgi:uncharacterized membrane protein